MSQRKLPKHLHSEALRRLRHCAQMASPPAESDRIERALNLRAWLRAASLDSYGWSVKLDADRRLVVLVGRRRIDLEPPPSPPLH